MAHQLTPYDFEYNDKFELLAKVEYNNIKPFIVSEIKQKSTIIRIYGFVQLLASIAIGFIVTNSIIEAVSEENNLIQLWWTLGGLFFSLSLLIVVHELIHGLAFYVLGKRDIGFGAQWRKFMFYAEANREVINRKEMAIIALAPLVLVAILCIVTLIATLHTNAVGFVYIVLAIHPIFCAGDIAIVSFFNRYKQKEMYTFDDREKRATFYYIAK